jgi:hypothetical protein
MTPAEKRRIEDLERRIKELEARPHIVVNVPPIYAQPPAPQPWYPPPHPWYVNPFMPWYGQTVCDSQSITAGVAVEVAGDEAAYPFGSSVATFGLAS